MYTTQFEIANFLCRMKRLVDAKRNIYFVRRRENEATLLKLNLTIDMVWKELLKLRPSNYSKGPETDHDGSDGEVWVFLHPVTGVRVYIKLKLFEVKGQDYLKVLSFHT